MTLSLSKVNLVSFSVEVYPWEDWSSCHQNGILVLAAFLETPFSTSTLYFLQLVLTSFGNNQLNNAEE